MIKYLIIEKEVSTIDRIGFVLNEFLAFTCIGIADTSENAMNLILKESPDLVFINMDNVLEDVFQFIQEFNKYQEFGTEIVAISSSKEDAYLSLKSGFLDFLLLPLSELDLRKAIIKFQKKTKVNKVSTICIKSYKDYRYLCTKKILFLKADNNTSDFYMTNNLVITAFKTLKTYEDLLPNNFKRIHKSYIVNSNYVSRINYGKSNCSVKQGANKIPFSKTYLEKVNKINHILNQSTIHVLN